MSLQWSMPFALVLAVTLLAGTACASVGTSAPAATDAAVGETNNGEAPAVRYTDAREHYRIDGPGAMTVSADGSASYKGSLERLQVTVLHGSAAADPAATAAADVASLRTNATAFKLMSGPSPVRLGNLTAQKFVYRWTDGTSTVTGKPNDLISVRYYISKDSTTLAAISYGITAGQYDPQGADDVALTFAWQ
jgi:hypothetical protein